MARPWLYHVMHVQGSICLRYATYWLSINFVYLQFSNNSPACCTGTYSADRFTGVIYGLLTDCLSIVSIHESNFTSASPRLQQCWESLCRRKMIIVMNWPGVRRRMQDTGRTSAVCPGFRLPRPHLSTEHPFFNILTYLPTPLPPLKHAGRSSFSVLQPLI